MSKSFRTGNMKWILCPKYYLLLQSRCFSCGMRVAAWSSQTVRSTFIDFFKNQDHVFVPSSSVIPRKLEGTYFTNAGMNQFKPLILGELHPTSQYQSLVRAVNSQKCVRVGGKHNDLEDVGYDLTHHTFFEMLGNWSFGDYFKADACHMAYRLLIEHYGIPADRLYFTYFAGDDHLNLPNDDECKQLWLSLGIPEFRVLPFGAKDNFWEMGMTGPCGPCTEIHFDHVGGRDASSEVNSGSTSVVEVWNLVFMQYNRQSDQSLRQLDRFHVDTGMGLERMTAVLNSTADNYSTDLFLPLFEVIQKHAGSPPYKSNKESINTSYRMLADHARMFTVAISDGLLPSNHNLGHKLRTILHRCIGLCRNTFQATPEVLLPSLVSAVVHSLGNTYSELYENEQRVCDVVKDTIEHHDRQRGQAVKSFNKYLSKSGNSRELTAEVMVDLEKGAYGSPMSIELVAEQAKANGLILDMTGYEKLMQKIKITTNTDPLVATADAASALVSDLISRHIPQTDDTFKYHYTSVNEEEYDFTTMYQATSPSLVQGLSSDGEVICQLEAGSHGEVILDRTCFYAESGGQEGDTGRLVSETGEFLVSDVQSYRGYVIHYGHVTSGCLLVGQTVDPTISQASRVGCMRNHTSTHLLNSALAEFVLSSQQQGSSVTPFHLTFDVHSLTPLDKNHVKLVEDNVREAIKKELQVSRRVILLDLARKLHKVRTLQNEEYPSMASVVTVESHDGSLVISTELCAGTHVVNTGHINDFCITNMTTKSHNVKRLTCVSGQEAQQAHIQGSLLQSMSHLLQRLLVNELMPHQNLDKYGNLIQKASRLLDSRVEILQHDLVFSCEDKSRLRDLIEDNRKAKDIYQAFAATIEHLVHGSAEREDIMKDLATHIRKSRQLELIPKTVRDDAHDCLERSEYKVAEALNKRGSRLLLEMLEPQLHDSSATSPVMLQIDHLDISPRQIAKTLSQMTFNKSVVLVQKSSRIVHVLISLPVSLVKPFTKDELDQVLKLLICFGDTKGKLASEKINNAVYTVSIKADVESADVINKLREESLFVR